MTTDKQNYNEFILRRLHSLTGVLPLTVFIFFHFFANSYSRQGDAAFNRVVDSLRGLPYLPFISWGLLLTPFLFHIVLGLWIVFTGKSNALRQPHPRNFAFFLQRVTAIIVMVFVIYHVVSMKYVHLPENGINYYAKLSEKFANPYVYWWYVIGVAATAFHLANGICTFCMTWGITVGRTSQRFMALAMTGAGIIVFLIGISALNGFVRAPKADAARPPVVSAVR